MMTILLTHKQLLFVENYIQTGGNGTASARAAGYRGNAATLGAVANENLNKPHVLDEIQRRQAEIRERLEISTQAKRVRLWNIAEQCAIQREISRSMTVETMPDGTVVKTIHVLSSVYDPAAAIRAIHELNLMDGAYAVSRKRRFRW